MSVVQIREAIDKLTFPERVEISEWLLATTTAPEDDDELDEVIALAEQRCEEMRTGKAKGVPWEEVRQMLDKVCQA